MLLEAPETPIGETKMQDVIAPAPASVRKRGRGLFWLGITLPFIALAVYIVQFQFKMFFVPWYVPIASLIGLGLLAVSIWQRPSIVRIAGLVLIALFCVGQGLFFTVSKLPAYSGPVHVGETIPSFQTIMADGGSFSDRDLKQGKASVLLFFRG